MARWTPLRLIVGAATCVAALAPAARAQTGDTLAIPSVKYTLPNGLEVILHEDHSTPVVAVDTWYHVGSSDEKAGRTGFAHLFEHIMFMGSEHAPTGTFEQLLESSGANNNGSTNQDRTNYYESGPSNTLPLMLWLDSDRMGWLLPILDQSKLDLQREVVKNERRQRYDNVPYGRAYETLLAGLFPASHPYSWATIGSMTDLTAATLGDVKQFFTTYYAPNNASIAIAGDFNPDSARAWVQKYFGGVPRGPQMPARPVVPTFALARDTFLVQEDRVQLPRVEAAWHTVKGFADDDATLDVLAYVLAGNNNARLYKKLVYDAQVAQDVNAFQNSERLDGMFIVSITAKPNQKPQALWDMAMAEIAKVANSGITQRELDRARNTTRAQFLDRIASVSGKADQLNFYNYFVGRPDYVQQDAARYDRVTAADVQRVARTYLMQPKVVLSIVPEGQRDLMVTGGTR